MSYVTEKFVEVHPGRRIFWFNWNRPDIPTTISWSNVTGKPATFPPSSHTHSWDEITGKPTTFPTDTPEPSIFDLSGCYFNALKDGDDEPLFDGDGFALYDPGDTFDNPPVPTRYDCSSIEELLSIDGWSWDRAVTRHFITGDGQRTEWRQSGDPTLTANGFNIHATADGYGFAERVAILS